MAKVLDFVSYRAARLALEARADVLVQEVMRRGLEAPLYAVEQAAVTASRMVLSGHDDGTALAAAVALLNRSAASDEE